MPVAGTPDTFDCLSLQDLPGDVNEKNVSWPGNADNFSQAGAPLSDTSDKPSVAPGTIAKTSPTPLKPMHNSAFSVEPGSLPSWITEQPLAYLKYGAAPAVVTLHFGHK